MDSNDRRRRCVVPICNGERFDLVHKFPMETDRTLKWLKALNIPHLFNVPYDKLRKSYFVCSRHFRSQDYKNPISRHLNKTAVPNINIKNLDQIDLMFNRNQLSSSKFLTLKNGNNSNVPPPSPSSSSSSLLTTAMSMLVSNTVQQEVPNNNKNCTKRSCVNRKKINNDSNNDNESTINEPQPKLKRVYEESTVQLKAQHFKILCSNDDDDNKDDNVSNDDVDDDDPNNDDFSHLIIENDTDDSTDEINKSDDQNESVIEDEKDYQIENLEEEKKEIKEYRIDTDIRKNEKQKQIFTSLYHRDHYHHNRNYIDETTEFDESQNFSVSMITMTSTSMTAKNNQDNNTTKSVITMTSKFLKIKHPITSELISLDYFWLRDHCRCTLCFNYETYQRRYNLLDLQLDTKPQSYDFKDNKLFVTWDDEHESEYEIDFIFKSQCDYIKKDIPKQILWDKKKITTEQQYAIVDLGDLVTNDQQIETILKSLITYGVAFIKNVPATQDMTEMAIRRLFPIQKTLFGEMWTFSDLQNENHLDTAYTKDYLEAHTDNTYFSDAAGLQIFHCLEHVNGTGGDTFLIDGFKIIQDLMKQNYDAYQKLVEINIPAEYMENDCYHKYSAPLIRLNYDTKKPEQIRFNLYDRSVLNTLPQTDMREFYEHFRYITKLIQIKDNQWKFKLNPGTILIFDNWRILHGRESYTGKRKMCGCYVSRTEFLSKARIFGLIK